MDIPIRVVFSKYRNYPSDANYFTTFDLLAEDKEQPRTGFSLGKLFHPDEPIPQKSDLLLDEIAKIPGVSYVRVENHTIRIVRSRAFLWAEISPHIIEALEEVYGFSEIKFMRTTEDD